MNKESMKKLVTGEAPAKFVEAWFTYLGFLTLTAIFHAIANKSGISGFIFFKWVCYVGLWVWVMYKIDQAIWFLFPTTNPKNSINFSGRAHFWSVLISTSIAGNSYFIAVKAIELINSINIA